MGIFRGVGGVGDADTDAFASEVNEDALTAEQKANEAAASAAAAASSATAAASSATSAASDAAEAAASISTTTAAKDAAEDARDTAIAAKDTAVSAQAATAMSETNAAISAANSSSSATAAATSETSAAASATSATVSANTATTKATEAATSATNALASANAAANSATEAATVVQGIQDDVTQSAANAAAAQAAAENAVDLEAQAALSAASANNSATAAAGSASTASTASTNATTKATEAAASASSALTSANNAASSETASAASEAAAAISATTATTQASNASTSASQAATSASNASDSETAAAASETAAATSETNAAASATSASASATSATSSATSSASSASSAASSAADALTSETNAANSATAASSSASSAATSAATATTKATESANSATAALASETAAAASESAAAASEANASNSEAAASASETAAASSEAAALASQQAAATSASSAATSASSATTSATSAASSAATATSAKDTAVAAQTSASSSASAAASSATSAASSALAADQSAQDAQDIVDGLGVVATVTAGDISNWDSAYSWGNHAGLYAAASHTHAYLPSSHDMTLTLSGDASGSTTFTNMGNATLSVTVADDSHNHNTLYRSDNRTISPSEYGSGRLAFGFTSWANNNSAPYADFLNLRSYTDSSGGSDNLVMFKKDGIGMRIWQQSYGSTTAYSSYADVWTTANDGAGSGLDADLLDGQHASAFAPASHSHSYVSEGGTSFNGTYPMVVRVGTNNFYSNGNITFNGTTNGLTVDGRVDSPIFYDSNNTAYYVNPNGASQFSQLDLNLTTNHGLRVGGIRGRPVGSETGDYLHLYERVHIGYPSGWGGKPAPSYGLSTYGDIRSGGQIRATGWYNNTSDRSATGLGAEIGVSGGYGYLLAYNRDTSSYGELHFGASSVHSEASFYAPIMYDRDNSAYYMNPASGGKLAGTWDFTNGNLYNVNHITINDPGPGEGIAWNSGNGWAIYESPDNLTTNGAGNLQFVTGSNRNFTVDTGGGGYFRGNLTVGGTNNSSNIYMNDNDHGQRILHCNSNRIGFLSQAGSWGAYLDDGTTWLADGAMQSPIYYDINNTGYYVDPNSTSNMATVQIQGTLRFMNYGLGVTGTYTSTRLQTIFNMDDQYSISADGSATNNCYGLYWSHPNAGSLGGANNLNDHGLLIINNGSFRAAISSRAVFSQDVRGTLFYDYNNTGYYADPASTSVFNDFRCDIMYDKDNTSYYARPGSTSMFNDLRGNIIYDRENTAYYFGSSHGDFRFRNGTVDAFTANGNITANSDIYGKSVNGAYSNLYRFGGIYFTWDSDSYGTNSHHSIRSTDGDSYGDHITINSFGNIRFNFDSNSNGTNYCYWGHATTGTGNVLMYLDESGNLISGTGSHRAPIFYDSDNTGYYANPASTSNFNALNVVSGNIVPTASMSGSGYWKCNKTGLIIQWGNKYVGNNGSDYFSTWTFPLAFPNACWNVYVTLYNTTGNSFDASSAITSQTTTSAGFTVQEWSNQYQAITARFIAIGY